MLMQARVKLAIKSKGIQMNKKANCSELKLNVLSTHLRSTITIDRRASKHLIESVDLCMFWHHCVRVCLEVSVVLQIGPTVSSEQTSPTLSHCLCLEAARNVNALPCFMCLPLSEVRTVSYLLFDPKSRAPQSRTCLKETKRMKQCFERQNVIESVQKQNIWRECIFKAIVQQSSEVNTVGSTYSGWTNRIQTWFIHATLLRSYWRTYRPAKSPTRTSSQQTQNLNWNRMVLLCWRCTAMAKFLTMATISGMKRPREASPLVRTTLSWAVSETNEKMDLKNTVIVSNILW